MHRFTLRVVNRLLVSKGKLYFFEPVKRYTVVALAFLCFAALIYDAAAQRLFIYRNLATRFDSCGVGCKFGEFCIPNYGGSPDSLFLEWANSFNPANSVSFDATEEYINTVTQTKPFVIPQNSFLSFFHILNIQYDYTRTYSVPDTIAWSIELWQKSPWNKIATIDSVAIYPAMYCDTSRSPGLYGFTSYGFESMNISLSQYVGTDSVYLLLKMNNSDGSAKDSCSIIDDMGPRKLSEVVEEMVLGKKPAKKDPEPKFCIDVFPNPPVSNSVYIKISSKQETRVRVDVFSSSGALAATVFDARLRKGSNLIPYRTGGIPSGTYFIRAVDDNGNLIDEKKISIHN